MKKILIALAIFILPLTTSAQLRPLTIPQGGTGTSTRPSYGELLLGNSLGGYDLVATSTLGISGGGSSSFSYPFTPTSHFGQTVQATSSPLWLQSGLFASSTSYLVDANIYGDLFSNTATADTIASFNSSKVLTSLSLATYPSLTELSYLKGVTSAIQTQLSGKQATLVSGTNIKTINSTTLLGSGDIAVATTAQGALADSALQSGDNISELTNDSGYITSSALTPYLPLAGGTLTGNLLFTDNTYDIGASGATRPRTGYFGTSISAPTAIVGTVTFNGATNVNPLLRSDAATATLEVVDGTQSVYANVLAAKYTAGTSVVTPLITNAGTLALSATGANKITFSTNGTQRMEVAATGGVGVGRTNAGTTILEVNANVGVFDSSAPAYYQYINSTQYGVWRVTGTEQWFGTIQSIPLYFMTSNTERMRITSGGNVGIGTTTPGAKLSVIDNSLFTGNIPLELGRTDAIGDGSTRSAWVKYFGTAGASDTTWVVGNTGNYFSFSYVGDRATAPDSGSKWLNITNAGNVGIGTTAPGAKLDVNGGFFNMTSSGVAHGLTAVAPTNAFASMRYTDSGLGGIQLYGITDADGTAINMSAIIGSTDPADATPAFVIQGGKSNGTTSWQALAATETVLQVKNFSTNLMTVLGSGNVGIGTTSPVGTLTIVKDSGAGVLDTDAESGILIKAGTSDAMGLRIGVDTTNNIANIQSVEDGVAARDLILNGGGGNVGIGTTGPNYKLEVNGTSGFTGNMVMTTDNTYDIGASGATRPRTGYFGTSITSPFARFTYASTTLHTTSSLVATSTVDFSSATVTQKAYPSFTYATSTAWTATTTIPLGTAFVTEAWNSVQCFTDTGTLNVSFYDGTNRMNMFNASTTVGTVGLTTNNTFTTSEKRYVDIGTPASSPTKISCTIEKMVNN